MNGGFTILGVVSAVGGEEVRCCKQFSFLNLPIYTLNLNCSFKIASKQRAEEVILLYLNILSEFSVDFAVEIDREIACCFSFVRSPAIRNA